MASTRVAAVWPVAALAALVAAGSPSATGAVRREAWDPTRLRDWIEAVDSHAPGRVDPALLTAAGWSNDDLRALWIDTQAALLAARTPTAPLVVVEIDPTSVLATEPVTRGRRGARPDRVRTLALDRAERQALEALAVRVRAIGADVAIERGAILHTDVLTLAPEQAAAAMGPTAMRAPRGMLIGDGRSLGLAAVSGHRAYTRMLLERLSPAAAAFERDWYRATLAVDQSVELFDDAHLERALRRFPDDGVVQRLAGCQHEAFASPLFQEFARTFRNAALSPGIRDTAAELSDAERHFRRAVAADAQDHEARLRLANVQALQGRHGEAAPALETLLTVEDPMIGYYAALFLGRSQEAQGAWPAASLAYARAVQRMPGARVPRLAMARLALEQGDRTAMARHLDGAVQRVTAATAIDPWWEYRHMQGRVGQAWLEALRATAAAP